MSSGYSVDSSSGILKISGPSIENAESGDWSIREFGVGRFLLQSNELTKQMPISNDGNAWCSIDTFTDFIFGVHHRKWSGTIVVDTGFGIKRVYFLDGEIVFAGTNVMDDRLGEVLYRKGLLTIDQLMDTSVKVSREKKFGQVLLASGVFSNLQLWDALKCQVRELVRSIFMSEYVYFEMLRDNAPAPTQVVFTEGSYSFLESCHGYGCMYRDFVARLQQDTEVQVINPEYVKLEVGEGNFIADLIGMIEKSKNIEDILRTSKLLELNTLAALMLLVNRGICSISPSEDSQLHSDKLHLKKLQNKLDIYSFMLSEVRKAFQMNGVSLPVTDLRMMAEGLDEDSLSTIFLTQEGHISQGSIERIFSQCKSTHSRVNYFVIRIDCLVQFLLQLSLDHLPYEIAKGLRAHYKRLAS